MVRPLNTLQISGQLPTWWEKKQAIAIKEVIALPEEQNCFGCNDGASHRYFRDEDINSMPSIPMGLRPFRALS
jgi:hypothetical protein